MTAPVQETKSKMKKSQKTPSIDLVLTVILYFKSDSVSIHNFSKSFTSCLFDLTLGNSELKKNRIKMKLVNNVPSTIIP